MNSMAERGDRDIDTTNTEVLKGVDAHNALVEDNLKNLLARFERMIWPLEHVPEKLEAWAKREAESTLLEEERYAANTLAQHTQALMSGSKSVQGLDWQYAELDKVRKEAAQFVMWALDASGKEVAKTGTLINQVMPAMRDYAGSKAKEVFDAMVAAQETLRKSVVHAVTLAGNAEAAKGREFTQR